MKTAIAGARIADSDHVLENGTVVFEAGRIVSVRADAPPPTDAQPINAHGLTLLPGFLDCHIHGGGGHDTMEATPEALQAICRTHATYGTTGLFATTMTQSRDATSAALQNARAAYDAGTAFCPDGAQVLGIHLEGPYISPARPGAQPKAFVRDYDAAEFAAWLDISGDALKLITLAPERPGADELTAACRKRGIVVSMGHTDATADETKAAIEQGVTHATHLFNAMPGIHHRKPGPIPVLLTDVRAMVEVIADGHHVAPEVIALIFKAAGKARVVLITDAMSGAGASEGVYDLGGHAVTVSEGKAVLADGTLAGSVLTMVQAAKNIRDWLGLQNDWSALAALTSGNAARQFRLSTKGRIAPSCDADLVLISDDFTVQTTFVAGRPVFSKP